MSTIEKIVIRDGLTKGWQCILALLSSYTPCIRTLGWQKGCANNLPSAVTLKGGQLNREKDKGQKDEEDLFPAREIATHVSTLDHEDGQPAPQRRKI